jgi:predicted dehydrogenase
MDWPAIMKALRDKTPAKRLRHGARQPERLRPFRPALDRGGKELLGAPGWRRNSESASSAAATSRPPISCFAPLFKGIEMRACADIDMKAAQARAKEFGVRASSVADLLASDDIDIVVNLTIPAAHYEVSRRFSTPASMSIRKSRSCCRCKEGLDLKKRADRKGLRVGSAPDTFLGGAHQRVRSLIDGGKVGRVTSGTCYVMSHGMEHWHPNPDFFFQPGGGPILDIGPYYITNLVQLIGPVKRVAALAATPAKRAYDHLQAALRREGAR